MTHETAPCVGCGEETQIGEAVTSPVCYRPLCPVCRGETDQR
jgi:hypothetical protein